MPNASPFHNLVRYLLHGARRRGATWVHAVHGQADLKPPDGLFADPQRPVAPWPNLALTDNGRGIPSPLHLAAPGYPAWQDGARQAPLESLSPLPASTCAILTRDAQTGAAWALDHQDTAAGSRTLPLPAGRLPEGGTCCYIPCSLRADAAGATLQAEALHYPLSVTFEAGSAGGFPPPLIDRRDFLAGAERVALLNTVRIGFFKPGLAPTAQVNVFGLACYAPLPPVCDRHVRLDVLDAPALQLDPRHKAVRENAFLQQLVRRLPDLYASAPPLPGAPA